MNEKPSEMIAKFLNFLYGKLEQQIIKAFI